MKPRLFITFTPPREILTSYEPETEDLMGAISVLNDSTTYMALSAYAITGENLWTYFDACVVSMKTALGLSLGTRTLKDRLAFWYPFLLDLASTQKYNAADITLYEGAFSGGVTNSGAGFQGNGTNGYFNTNCSMFDAGLLGGDISLHIYTKSLANGAYADIGAIDATAGREYDILMYTYQTGNFVSRLGNNGTNNSNATGTQSGLYSITRDNSSDYDKYVDSSLLATPSVTMTANQNYEYIYVGCRNNDGTPSQYSPRLFTHAIFGDSMTSTEIANIQTALDTLDTALNRF